MRPRTTPPVAPPALPHLIEEEALRCQGFSRVAGLDEAGRGSWAGPLVAGAVTLPAASAELVRQLDGIKDSKQLSARRRDELLPRILDSAIDVGVGVVSPATIDRVGLSKAGELAMIWALEDMASPPDCLLIDAFPLRSCPLYQRPIIRGDCISLSIAAASIVAKVTRDRIMAAAEQAFPGYGFAEHKGYGTELHRRAIVILGPSPYHRFSFGPIRACRGLPL